MVPEDRLRCGEARNIRREHVRVAPEHISAAEKIINNEEKCEYRDLSLPSMQLEKTFAETGNPLHKNIIDLAEKQGQKDKPRRYLNG